jgi:hypothetical protein
MDRVRKLNISESTGCTHIHQRSRKNLKKRCVPTKWLMAFVFWERKGVMMVGFMQQGTTVTPEAYCETVEAVRRAIHNKGCGMVTCGIMLLHDNAYAYTAARTRALLEHFNWELFEHPHYSPALAPNDCHLFTYLKSRL